MASANVRELTTDNFAAEVTRAGTPVLVDFWAPWCGPCRMLAPAVDRIADRYAGKVVVGKVNTDDNQDLAARYQIDGIPCLLLFKGGEQPVDKIVGSVPEAEIARMIDRHLA